jgi:hypothetical protein
MGGVENFGVCFSDAKIVTTSPLQRGSSRVLKI